jgi:hypothetical protein
VWELADAAVSVYLHYLASAPAGEATRRMATLAEQWRRWLVRLSPALIDATGPHTPHPAPVANPARRRTRRAGAQASQPNGAHPMLTFTDIITRSPSCGGAWPSWNSRDAYTEAGRPQQLQLVTTLEDATTV